MQDLNPIRLIGRFALVCGIAMLLGSCSILHKEETTDLKLIYQKSAQYHLPDRNPIIVIPGILGSRLQNADTGQTVWGAFNGGSINPNTEDGARVISLPIEEGKPLSESKDNVVADGVLDSVDINLFGLPLNIRAYASILATLGANGYRDESLGLNGIDYGDDHFTCFQYAYDWRRDNVENAHLLQEFIDDKRVLVQANYRERYGIEDADVKFDIVAHSMGGLLARYFLRYADEDLPENGEEPVVTWAGAEDVERLILIGTPNAGSVKAFGELVNGFDVGLFLPHYESALLGTFPAVYQLLPRPRHKAIITSDSEDQTEVDIYDPMLWAKYEWGLASKDKITQRYLRAVLPNVATDEERRQIALNLQSKILKRSKAFHAAMDIPAEPPEGTDIYMVLGDAHQTASEATIDVDTGKIKVTDYDVGDGTVLRSSALMDERVRGAWQPELKTPIEFASVLFLMSDHLDLTSNDIFTDNVLFWLLEDPR